MLLGLIGIGGTILIFVVFDSPAPSVIGGTAIAFALWFVLGMMLAVASVCAEAGAAPLAVAMVRLRPGLNWVAAGAVFVVMSAWLPPTPFLVDTGQLFIAFAVLGLTSLLLLVPAVFDGGLGLPRRLIGNRFVAWLGLVSYGIFLWHVVVIRALGLWRPDLQFLPLLVVTVAVTVPIAAASYYLVERPVLRFKYRRIRLPVRIDPARSP